jgi:DNA-binding transcriptional LysR family regulator
MADRLDMMGVFVKVVEAGNLSAAARSLGTSLTSVSRMLTALEARLETRLLIRTPRHLSLTEEGRLYYEHARRILADVQAAEAAFSAHNGRMVGRVHVSAPSLFGRLRVAPILPQFMADNPGVSVDLTLVDRSVNLVEEGVDIAIQVGRLPDSNLIVRHLGNVGMVVCGAPSYLDRRGRPQTPSDLKEHDCLVFIYGGVPSGWRFRDGAEILSVDVPPRLRTNSLEVAVLAAVDGAGIVRAPTWQVTEHIAAGRLERVLEDFERPSTRLQAVFLETRLLPPRVRAFLDLLTEHCHRWMDEDGVEG